MSKNNYISLHQFRVGQQCGKRLWLESNERDLPELVAGQGRGRAMARADKADMLPILRGRYHNARTISVSEPEGEAAATLEALADASTLVVFRAVFLVDQVHIKVDIVEKSSLGLRLLIVKAAKSAKDSYRRDAVICGKLIQAAGHRVASLEIVHINARAIYPNLGDLFAYDDVTEHLKKANDYDAGSGKTLMLMKAGRRAPEIAPGAHCDDPEPCPFKDRCLGTTPAKKPQSKAGRRFSSEDLRRAIAPLEGKKLAFVDFESIAWAVPWLKDSRPYQAFPVQFSCHFETAVGYKHFEWLAGVGQDPRESFARELLSACADADRVVVFSHAEATTIKKLAEYLSSLKKDLASLHQRLFDLSPLVRKLDLPDYSGPRGLKAILPVLSPGASYAGLQIGHGSDASIILRNIIRPSKERPAAEIEADIAALKAYCQMDTWAMVLVLQALRKIANATESTDRPSVGLK